MFLSVARHAFLSEVAMKTKNLFLSVICLFSFILSGITAYSSNYHSEVKLASQQLDTSEHFIAFKLPLVAHTKKQFRQLITIVDESAQKFGLNYMEKNVYLGYPLENGRLNYAKSISEQNFYVNNLHKTSFLGNFGALGSDNSEYTYTYPLLKGYKVTIRPLGSVFKDRKNFEGVFFLETLDLNKYNAFITLLNQHLNQSFMTHYKPRDYQITRSTELLLPFLDDELDLSPLINSLSVFILIAVLIYLLLEWRSLRLYKLNGWSFWRSFLLLTLKPLFAILFAFIYDFWVISKHLELTELLNRQGFIFFAVLVISFLMVGLMYLVSLAPTKERYFSLSLFCLLGGIKIFFLLTLITFFAPLGSLLTGNYGHKDPELKKYAEFFPYMIGGNVVDDRNNATELKKIYQIADSQGALLLNDSGSSYKQPNTVARELTSVIINTNYLKLYPLRDVHNKKIIPDPVSKKLVLVFPDTPKDLVTKRLKYEQRNDPIAQKYGIKVFYSNPRSNQNFKNIVTGKNMANEIIMIVTPGNIAHGLTQYHLNILSGFANDSLLLPLKKTSLGQLSQQWEPILKKYNLSDNVAQLIRYDHGELEELRQGFGDLLAHFYEQLLLWLIVLALSFYSLLSFFKKNLTQIELKNMFGYSRLRNYYPYLVMLGLQYIVMLAFYPDQNIPKEVYLVVISLFFVLEFFIRSL